MKEGGEGKEGRNKEEKGREGRRLLGDVFDLTLLSFSEPCFIA
jgi:hypothetical protein